MPSLHLRDGEAPPGAASAGGRMGHLASSGCVGQTEEQPYLLCSFLTTPRPVLQVRGAQPAGAVMGGWVLPSEEARGWPVCRTGQLSPPHPYTHLAWVPVPLRPALPCLVLPY